MVALQNAGLFEEDNFHMSCRSITSLSCSKALLTAITYHYYDERIKREVLMSIVLKSILVTDYNDYSIG